MQLGQVDRVGDPRAVEDEERRNGRGALNTGWRDRSQVSEESHWLLY